MRRLTLRYLVLTRECQRLHDLFSPKEFQRIVAGLFTYSPDGIWDASDDPLLPRCEMS